MAPTTRETGMFLQTDHRPFPMPQRPWAMKMIWHDLLFAHWPVPVAVLRKLVPDSLELDTFDGLAWLGVIPFHMTGIRARRWPAVPGCSGFPEINVRTYVKHDGKPGIFFFSLDARHRTAVYVARRTFLLPYFQARIACKPGPGMISYLSQRNDRRAPAARFLAAYGATGSVFHAAPGSLVYWFTERYRLYTTDAAGRVCYGDIHHVPWPLQPARIVLDENTMADWLGIRLDGLPAQVHFSKRLEVVAWRLSRFVA